MNYTTTIPRSHMNGGLAAVCRWKHTSKWTSKSSHELYSAHQLRQNVLLHWSQLALNQSQINFCADLFREMLSTRAIMSPSLMADLPLADSSRSCWKSESRITFDSPIAATYQYGPFRASVLFISVFSMQFCRWLDSNCGPPVLEATVLQTEPQPLPKYSFQWPNIERYSSHLVTLTTTQKPILRYLQFCLILRACQSSQIICSLDWPIRVRQNLWPEKVELWLAAVGDHWAVDGVLLAHQREWIAGSSWNYIQ